jgi:hypothetical protein
MRGYGLLRRRNFVALYQRYKHQFRQQSGAPAMLQSGKAMFSKSRKNRAEKVPAGLK